MFILESNRESILAFRNCYKGKLSHSSVRQVNPGWEFSKKSKLIESLILNIPIPSFYLIERAYKKYEVIDGWQRINTIIDYLDGKFSLSGLSHLKHLEGKSFKELPYDAGNLLQKRNVAFIVVMKEGKIEDWMVRELSERLQ